MRTRVACGWLVPVAAFSVGAGCGLLNLATINFSLPPRSYSISTDDPRWRQPPAVGIPSVACPPPSGFDCCRPPAPAPPIDCALFPVSCDAATNRCALRFTYEQVSVIDLGKEVPELRSAGGQLLSEINLKSIDLTIGNSLNISLPDIGIFVAPASVRTALDPQARRIATVPPKELGYRGQESIPLDADAQRAFSEHALDFRSPFHVIVSASIVLTPSTPVPSGRLDVTVSGKVEAKF